MNAVNFSSLFRKLDLNLFRVFAVVCRERNLTRAAEQLHISQSAVSHALARLREQLHCSSASRTMTTPSILPATSPD
jgi:DNA-binding transcriptional LysR family regulator